ncbi:hypothetical protein D8B26_008274 [Coccidioides posadasii str. Silveira]|uniref:uncharacterized protein n=1 Tax=Coccidioides posadasii (strain RMSCC 757 / Silveira) TaxID=443226 RepID=UPI001BEFEB30|nr:hypothetical protein D8B26_008274 [Coccidioides posadasii str. Silveira]
MKVGEEKKREEKGENEEKKRRRRVYKHSNTSHGSKNRATAAITGNSPCLGEGALRRAFLHNLPPTTSSGRTTPWFPQLRFVYMLFRMEGQAPPTFFELILGERKGPYGVTGSDTGKSACLRI